MVGQTKNALITCLKIQMYQGFIEDELFEHKLFFSKCEGAPPGYPGRSPGISCQNIWFPWVLKDIRNKKFGFVFFLLLPCPKVVLFSFFFPAQRTPAVLKRLRDSELLHCSVFTTGPPHLLCREPRFEWENACKTKENSVSARGSPYHPNRNGCYSEIRSASASVMLF